MYSDTTRLEISVRSVLKRRYSTDFCILVLVCGTPMSCELKIGATAPSAQWRQFSLGGGCQPPQPPPGSATDLAGPEGSCRPIRDQL